ncbi:MAG: hypothetical protein WCP17_03585 [bacterium]
MFFNFLKQKKIQGLIFAFLLLIPICATFAQSMQSGTYKITSDSINVGGQSSTSSNYVAGDTLGENGTGDSNSANYNLHGGFWQMQESYIAISNPTDLVLSPIGGINGEASEGTMSWQVITDNAAGYSMNIKVASIPALRSATDSFADYVPLGANPDYNFSTPSNTSMFGFSPEGADTDARFRDNGVACNAGAGEATGKCWDGLSTIAKTIFQSSTSNHPGGTTGTIRFRAESGADHIQTAGSYSAPITVTAITL